MLSPSDHLLASLVCGSYGSAWLCAEDGETREHIIEGFKLDSAFLEETLK